MERVLLHRFFEGKTTVNEEKKIRKWLEASDANHLHFLKERRIYDALLLTDTKPPVQHKKKRISTIEIIATAAAVMLLLIIGGIYLLRSTSNPEQYNTILVPAGQRINLILSDNTNLWLNANTTFRYPTTFTQETRTVYLDGEAYFDVSKDEKKPFVVKTSQADIRVTGTSFNVESYSKHQSFETSLFEGGVEIFKDDIKIATLSPNQDVTLENEKILISEITNTDKFLWRHGLIAFNSKKLEEILITLEKYFDVKIQINTKKLPQYTYTGKFRQSDGVDYALRVLQKSIHFNYHRDEETGTIYIK